MPRLKKTRGGGTGAGYGGATAGAAPVRCLEMYSFLKIVKEKEVMGVKKIYNEYSVPLEYLEMSGRLR